VNLETGARELSSMLEAVILTIHCGCAGALIFLVLLHSGRGGGLSDMFGGGLGAAASGSTMVEKNLDRLTVVFGLIFAFTTLTLALMVDL
jgi:preprotein translocase subunit SecG